MVKKKIQASLKKRVPEIGKADAQQAASSYEQQVVAALGPAHRPPFSKWRPGTVGTAPDGTRFVVYSSHIRSGGDRESRTNNPGNVKIGTFARANGAIGRDGAFAVFPDKMTGVRAFAALLLTSQYGEMLVQDVLQTHLPNITNVVEARSYAARYTLDSNKRVDGLDGLSLGRLAASVTSSFDSARASVLHKSGKNPAWAETILQTAQSRTAIPAKPLIFNPANWVIGTWYIQQPDGSFAVSPNQNPTVSTLGFFVQYTGNLQWTMQGVNAPGSEDAGAPSPAGDVPSHSKNWTIATTVNRSDGKSPVHGAQGIEQARGIDGGDGGTSLKVSRMEMTPPVCSDDPHRNHPLECVHGAAEPASAETLSSFLPTLPTTDDLTALASLVEEQHRIIDARLQCPARWRGESRREVFGHAVSGDHDRYENAYNRLMTDASGEGNIDATWLCKIHAAAVGGGQFRKTALTVGGHDNYPAAESVPSLIERALARAVSNAEPVATAATRLHLDVIAIHPFSDGNGRAARLAAALILARAGFRSTLLVGVEQHSLPAPYNYFDLLNKFQYGEIAEDMCISQLMQEMAANAMYAAWFRARELRLRNYGECAGFTGKTLEQTLVAYDLKQAQGLRVKALAEVVAGRETPLYRLIAPMRSCQRTEMSFQVHRLLDEESDERTKD